MRLAFVGPLPPEPSGLAAHDAALLEHLTRESGAEIEAFSGERAARAPAPPGVLRVRPYAAFEEDGASAELALYRVGGDARRHAEPYRLALARPGLALLEGPSLHALVRARCAGSRRAFRDELHYAYGATGLALEERAHASGRPLPAAALPLFERLVDASFATLVHDEPARQRILRSRPRARVLRLPHALALGELAPPSDEERAAARARLAIGRASFTVACLAPPPDGAALEALLEAFEELLRERADATLLLASEASEAIASGEAREDIATREASEARGAPPVEGAPATEHLRVVPAGDAALRDAIAACDVALHLGAAGELSPDLLRLLARGVPAIVRDAGRSSELPRDACRKITSAHQLAGALLHLARDPEERARLSAAARAFARARPAPDSVARDLARLCADLAAAPPRPFPIVAPLLPHGPGDVATRLAANVAAELEALGIHEDDEHVLRSIAHDLAELGWSR